MKSFRELISWELEQERRNGGSMHSTTTEDVSEKVNASAMRKMRYLSSHRSVSKSADCNVGNSA